MAMTEFAMVEELASLIKDNLISKHLILSTEETIVDFLQNNASFAHESVGEGDNRHLVLMRCPESAIPSILVSDIVYQYDDQSSTSLHHILRREEAPVSRSAQITQPSITFEQREAAYLAARERIFSLQEGDEHEVVVPKSRKVPLVAQRMISHALGQKICSTKSVDQQSIPQKCEETSPANDGKKVTGQLNSTFSPTEGKITQPISDLPSSGKKLDEEEAFRSSPGFSNVDRKVQQPSSKKSSNGTLIPSGCNRKVVSKQNLEREQIGAAKRMFANALGLPSTKGNHGLQMKSNEGKKSISHDT
ncbi:SUZ domain-containing protein [Dioscorea alata]|uniref:SUZ domain-containing protein n=1 Tax=Dioscorea alata TaxID=55571 RepID=A0ACB7VA60_DIOAL|nr:SUZ domain-containing protein [Dioscorea alata]